MSEVYDKIVSTGNFELKDIVNIEGYLDMLIKSNPMALDNSPMLNKFPLHSDLKGEYISVLNKQFNDAKDKIINSIVVRVKTSNNNIVNSPIYDTSEKNQIFETTIDLPNYLGAFTYLFPVEFANSLIAQGELKIHTLSVEGLYKYSQQVEITNKDVSLDSPIILLEYPYASPGFFVVDGNHRVHKAHKLGIKFLEAYVLSERALLLLSASRIFQSMFLIHKNICFICSYMIGYLTLGELKSSYTQIGKEKFII